MSLHRPALTCALLFASACATTRAAPPPLARLSVDHFVGTIHTGALARSAPDDLREPGWFEVRVAYASAAPAPPLEPIAARTRQVFVENGGEPLRSHAALALGIVLVEANEARAAQPKVGEDLESSDPAWPGTTTVWRTIIVPSMKPVQDPPRAAWSSFALELSPADDPHAAPELALVLEAEGAPHEHLVDCNVWFDSSPIRD